MVKKQIQELAVFGGAPLFEAPLHVGAPNIGSREKLLERVNEMLDRRRLTNRGPFVRELEERIAAMLGVKHAIAMCNGTIALEIAIRALEMKGEVILPSMTFIATAHALQWQQITPVFCDIEPENYTIDPRCIEKMITPRTSGIIGVHLWGRPCEIDQLSEIARKHHLKLLFDAAHSFCCTYRGQMIGGFGDAEVLSFHATKFFNSFEGGAVLTNNDDLAAKIRLMQNFGFAGQDNVIYIGTNGKMSEVSAAMGLTSLESIDEFISVNYRNYRLYRQLLRDVPGIRVLDYDQNEQSNYQYIVLEIDEQATGLSRDQIVHILKKENILARRYFYPGCHRMEPYRSYFPHSGLLLPVTEQAVERVISLPTGTAVGQQDIERISALIHYLMAHAGEINAHFKMGQPLGGKRKKIQPIY